MAGSQNTSPGPEAAPGSTAGQAKRQTASVRNPTSPGVAKGGCMLLWLAICLVLALACLGAFLFWIYRIANGQVDSSRLITLGYLVTIYGLCIAGGWLWGRYQRGPEDEERQRQFVQMQGQIEQLSQHKQSLQQALQKALTAPGSAIEKARSGPAPGGRLGPQLSIYEQQVEPADNSDLAAHPHEKAFPVPGEHNLLDYGWRLIGASRRGYGHGYEGKYREDDFQVQFFAGQAALSPGATIALVAIADGVGSKSLSRWGARAAVKGATSLTEPHIQPLRKALQRLEEKETLVQVARSVLLEALWSAQENIVRCARLSQVSVEELQSTLLIFLAAAPTPETLFLASVQIGDGALLAHRTNHVQSEGASWKWLLHPQIQEAGNEVRPFLHSSEEEWQRHMRCNLLRSVDGIVAMTDGIADDIEAPFPSANNPQPDPFALVDDFYQRMVAPVVSSSQPAETLLRNLAYQKKQSYDDRTLIYLYR